MQVRAADERFDLFRTGRLAGSGRLVHRYGLAALLLLWGGFKFAAFEAEAIRPLVANSPLLSWLYQLLGTRGTSTLIGVVEVTAALLLCTRRWTPGLSAIGSLIAAAIFLVTLSFLITTPGAISPTSPIAGFLLKDVILLGAALYTAAAEALEGARVPRTGGDQPTSPGLVISRRPRPVGEK
jgi:uncharacterized membrane protein YkgB